MTRPLTETDSKAQDFSFGRLRLGCVRHSLDTCSLHGTAETSSHQLLQAADCLKLSGQRLLLSAMPHA